MQDNLRIFNQVKDTPQEARKPIEAGRLKGFTDINPMWRFKRLTEVFGPCGIGWRYEIAEQKIIPGFGDEVAAFVSILLFYREGDHWSDGIPGIGGSSFISKESRGCYTNNECFKMALSDAIGTACKALGMSADIFFWKDRTKYSADGYASDQEKSGQHGTEQIKSTDKRVELAMRFKLPSGPYEGMELQDVWRKDLGYIRALKSDPNTPADLLGAISVFSGYVRSLNKQ